MTLHFDAAICQQHGIATIREKFNSPTRIIEPTPKEVREQRQKQCFIQKNKSMKPGILTTDAATVNDNKQNIDAMSSRKIGENVLLNKNNKNPIVNETVRAQLAQPTAELDNVTVIVTVANDDHHDESYDNKETAINMKTPPQRRCISSTEIRATDEFIGLVEPKRQYYEQLSNLNGIKNAIITTTTTTTQKYNKSHSLERARKEQLPPLKPRSFSGGAANLIKSPKLQQRNSIKLATDIKICYDTKHHNNNITTDKMLTKQDNDIYDTVAHVHDLEHIPLPAIPTTTTSSNLMPYVKKLQSNKEPKHMHIVPMEVDASTKTNVVHATSKQVFDDACIYLRSVDLQDNTIAYIPAAITIVPSPTEHKMQNWSSTSKALEAKKICDSKEQQSTSKYYTDGEYIYKSKDEQEEKSSALDTCKKSFEITKLTNKYDELQHSIAEHLKQIDTYMINAKIALNQCLEGSRENEKKTRLDEKLKPEYGVELWPSISPHGTSTQLLVMETPLQTILKQFGHKANSASTARTSYIDTNIPKENMPVIEEALAELATIAKTIENFELARAPMSQCPELLIVKLKSVPEVQQPAQHVHIDDDELACHNEKEVAQNTVESVPFKLEHVADVVANYEQLLADIRSHAVTTDNTKSIEAIADSVAHDKDMQVIDICESQSELKNLNQHSTMVKVSQHQSVKSDSNMETMHIISTTTNDADVSSREKACQQLETNGTDDISSCKTIQSNSQLSLAQNESNGTSFDNFDTYQATYEIPSPFSLKRQISWSDTNTDYVDTNVGHLQNKGLQLSVIEANGVQPQQHFVSIGAWQPIISHNKENIREKSSQQGIVPPLIECNTDFERDTLFQTTTTTTTQTDITGIEVESSLPPDPPIRKYPAALIEPHVHARAASPFGLNAVENWLGTTCQPSVTPEPITSTPPPPPPPLSPTSRHEFTYISQAEGHNVGLLVHTTTPPPPSPSPPPPTPPPLPLRTTTTLIAASSTATEKPLDYVIPGKTCSVISTSFSSPIVRDEILNAQTTTFMTKPISLALPTTTTTRTTITLTNTWSSDVLNNHSTATTTRTNAQSCFLSTTTPTTTTITTKANTMSIYSLPTYRSTSTTTFLTILPFTSNHFTTCTTKTTKIDNYSDSIKYFYRCNTTINNINYEF